MRNFNLAFFAVFFLIMAVMITVVVVAFLRTSGVTGVDMAAL